MAPMRRPSPDPMHFDFATTLNLVSTLTLIGALAFTGLQVREANRARRDQAAIAVIQTALSENSAQALQLLSEVPEEAPASVIDGLEAKSKYVIMEFGLRLEVIGYMVFRELVELETVNDLAGGVVLSFWSRTKAWTEQRRRQSGHDEFLEWCQWLAMQIAQHRRVHLHKPAYLQHLD